MHAHMHTHTNTSSNYFSMPECAKAYYSNIEFQIIFGGGHPLISAFQEVIRKEWGQGTGEEERRGWREGN